MPRNPNETLFRASTHFIHPRGDLTVSCGTIGHGLHSSRGHQVNLGSLAADILFELLDHLSVPDVLRVRQVCSTVSLQTLLALIRSTG